MKFVNLFILFFSVTGCGSEATTSSDDIVSFELSKKPVETPIAEELDSNVDEPNSPVPIDEEQDDDFISLNFTNIRSDKGQICYSITGPTKSFPPSAQEALVTKCTEVEGNSFTIEVSEQIVYGNEYAISIFHDENENENLDTKSLLGFKIPKEGFGFSKNPGVKIRGYKFKDCSFEAKENLIVNISMQYINI